MAMASMYAPMGPLGGATRMRTTSPYQTAMGLYRQRYQTAMGYGRQAIGTLRGLGARYAPGGEYGATARVRATAAKRRSLAAGRYQAVQTGLAPGYGMQVRAEFEKERMLEQAEERRRTLYADIMNRLAALQLGAGQMGLSAQPPAYSQYR